MSLSAVEIAQVVQELAPLVGAAVQKAWAPEPRTVVLSLRVPGATHLLLLSAEASLTRLHLVEARPRGEPAPFQGPLRAEVEGTRLAAVEATPGDRVVRLRFERREGARTLVAELTGRHGNLFLLDEAGVVLHSAVPNLSQRRDNVRGRPYEPPRPRPMAVEEASRFEGAPDGPFAVNRAVAARYAPAAARRALEDRRRELLRPLKTVRDRVRRTLTKVDRDAAKAQGADRYRRWGELLKTELHALKKGATEAEVTDWYAEGAPKVRVPLAPELSPKENMERYFRLHRRYADAVERIAARRRSLEAERDRVEALVARIEAAEDPEALEAAAGRAPPAWLRTQAPPRVREAEARVPYRRFVSATGRDILVGRGAKDNHALTFQVARGNDVWMHARDATGSHVVVPTGGTGETDEQTLLDAGHLAAHFSKLRGEPVVEVTWTQRKHVHHPKGAAAGLVTYAAARSLGVRIEPGRLARLLASERL